MTRAFMLAAAMSSACTARAPAANVVEPRDAHPFGAQAPDHGPPDPTSGEPSGPADEERMREQLSRCRRPWPVDPNDPRVGVYVFEEPLPPDERRRAWPTALLFDGATVTREWRGFTNLPLDCEYGELEDVPPIAWLRARAYVRPRDQTLWSLVPCKGWELVGRFLDDGRFEATHYHVMMRRADTEDSAAFDAIDTWNEDHDLLFWVCQPPYEAADGDPMPEPPR